MDVGLETTYWDSTSRTRLKVSTYLKDDGHLEDTTDIKSDFNTLLQNNENLDLVKKRFGTIGHAAALKMAAALNTANAALTLVYHEDFTFTILNSSEIGAEQLQEIFQKTIYGDYYPSVKTTSDSKSNKVVELKLHTSDQMAKQKMQMAYKLLQDKDSYLPNKEDFTEIDEEVSKLLALRLKKSKENELEHDQLVALSAKWLSDVGIYVAKPEE